MKIFRTRSFKWWEIGLLKVCLISFGIILAIYFYSSVVGLLWFWWAIFILTTLYFLIKVAKEQ